METTDGGIGYLRGRQTFIFRICLKKRTDIHGLRLSYDIFPFPSA